MHESATEEYEYAGNWVVSWSVRVVCWENR